MMLIDRLVPLLHLLENGIIGLSMVESYATH